MNMSNISGVVARVFVDDLDAAIPLYQQLAQTTSINRFGFRDVQLAQIGPFLLLSGNTARYRDRVATILVRNLPPVAAAIQAAGGHILEGPARPRTATGSSPDIPTGRSSSTSRPETSGRRPATAVAQRSNSRCRTSLATLFRGPIRLTASTARSSGWVLASSRR